MQLRFKVLDVLKVKYFLAITWRRLGLGFDLSLLSWCECGC